MRKNPYVYDQHIGKQVKREHFSLNGNRYCKNTDLTNSLEWYSQEIKPHQWVAVPTTIELELAYETRKSRRLW
jgi:hypothetical protein